MTQIQDLLKENSLQAIFLTKPENIHYFTGFVGSFGQAILTKDKTYLITDSRYATQAKKLNQPNLQAIIIDDYEKDLQRILKKHKVIQIGFEDSHLTVSQFKSFKKYFKGIKLKALKNNLDLLRQIKTQAEIRLIQKSQKINEQTLTEARKLIQPGISEAELAWKIVDIGHNFGAEDVSFYPIVAFGKNSSLPHSSPSSKKYSEKDVVLIDMGFKYQGYCSDMTRTFLPANLNLELINVYQTVLEAQENCIKNLHPNHKGSHGDQLSRSIIKKAGYGEYFTHANGHGVGLEIHEAPSLSFKTKHKDRNLVIQENMIITVEPGIYLPNKFGVRIEDMIQIKSSKNKNLTTYPKRIQDITLN